MSSKLKLFDQIVLEEFKNILIVDDGGIAHKVPILWATDEKAKSAMSTVKTNTVTREERLILKLPCMNLYLVGYVPVDGAFSIQYKLNCYTLYVEDMNQVVEQILLKFTPSCPTSKLSYKFPLELKNILTTEESERLVKYSFDFELMANLRN